MTWKVIEKREQASPLLGGSYFLSLTKDAKKIWGLDLDFIAEFKNRSLRMAVPLEKWHQVEQITLNKLADKSFVQAMEVGFHHQAKELEIFGKKILQIDFKKMPNQKLSHLFEQTIQHLIDFGTYSHWINGCDFEYHLFTGKLMAILQKHTKENTPKLFTILTTPLQKTLLQQQEEDLLKLLKIIKNNQELTPLFKQDPPTIFLNIKNNPIINEKLETHTKKYSWLFYEQEGTPLTVTYFIGLILEMLKSNIDPEEELNKIAKKEEGLKLDQKELKKELGLSTEEEGWLDLAAKIMFLKVYMRELKVRAYCSAHELTKEIAQRLGLDKIQVRHLTPEEIKQALETNKVDSGLINRRVKHSVAYFKEGKINIFIGEEAGTWSSKLVEDEPSGETDEIQGTCANPGQAKGIVKQILKPEDMVKFNKGDILVAYMTDPGIVPAMKKAAAIITEVGGITCHAAIVAREFGVPCVVGTRFATKVFKDGDLVGVDANRGIVRKISP